MENNEIKKDNKKALPMFIGIIVLSAVVGFVLGLASVFVEHSDRIGELGALFGKYMAPCLMVALAIIGFVAVMAEAIILQQKAVDAVKSTNPEKKGSVYDMRFQKKWLASCDEAEKAMIGQCAYKAYQTTNTTCTVLAVILALSAMIFGTGFLPSLAVCIVWLANTSAYMKAAKKLGRVGVM
ncbi:MAG: DUF3169 family protein [Oscillospiraceae bacterium]|nr:DUF3169 family protein [Oscillospiraceae bacterium]